MFKLTVALVAAAALASAQTTPDVSACILNCTTTSLPAGNCTSVTDLTCICTSTDFQAATLTCLTNTCPDQIANATALQTEECSSSSSSSTEAGSPTDSSSHSTSHSTSTSHSSTTSATTSTGAGFHTASIATGVTLALFGAAISLF